MGPIPEYFHNPDNNAMYAATCYFVVSISVPAAIGATSCPASSPQNPLPAKFKFTLMSVTAVGVVEDVTPSKLGAKVDTTKFFD